FDDLGAQGWLRPNFIHPPFNNRKAREALLHMMDQGTYLAWAVGQSDYYRPCYSVFACGGPHETEVGAGAMIKHHITKAPPLVKESGYDGQPIVVLQITDRPSLSAAAVVTRQRLESIGFKVGFGRACSQGAARKGRLEFAAHLFSGGGCHQSCRPLR